MAVFFSLWQWFRPFWGLGVFLVSPVFLGLSLVVNVIVEMAGALHLLGAWRSSDDVFA